MTTPDNQNTISQSVPSLEHSDVLDNYENSNIQFNDSYEFINGISTPFEQGSLHRLFLSAKINLHKQLSQGNPLSQDELKELRTQYPNNSYPDGIDKDTADWITSYGITRDLNDIVKAHPADEFGKVANTVGGFIGNSLEIGSATGGALFAAATAPEELTLGGAATVPMLRLAGLRAFNLASFGLGSALTEEASNYLLDRQTGEKYDGYAGLLNIGSTTIGSAALGGIGSLAFNGIYRNLAPAFKETLREVPDNIAQAATNAYDDFARTGATSSEKGIKDISKRVGIWNSEYAPNDARKVNVMNKLLPAVQVELNKLGENADPEIQKSLTRAMKAHNNLLETHNDLIDERAISPERSQIATKILNEFSPVSPDHAASIEKIAYSQFIRGKDVDIETPFAQAVFERAAQLRKDLTDQNLSPEDIASAIDNRRQELIPEMEKTNSDIRQLSGEIDNTASRGEDTADLMLKKDVLKEKLSELQQEDAAHEFIGKALRGEFSPPSGDNIKNFLLRETNNTDNIKDLIPDLGIGEEPKLQTFEEAEKQKESYDPESFKREGEEFNEYNKEIDAGNEEVAKIDRRRNKLKDLITSAINCLTGTE